MNNVNQSNPTTFSAKEETTMKRSRRSCTFVPALALLSLSILLKRSFGLVQPLPANNNNAVASTATAAATSRGLHVERMTVNNYLAERRQPGGARALDNRPILITDAMSAKDCEVICEEWIQAVGSETITVQRKQQQQEQLQENNSQQPTTHTQTQMQLYECTVAQSLDLMMQSSPQNSIFAFVEGLLESDSVEKPKTRQVLRSIAGRLTAAREALFVNDPNWFDFFPENVRPSDCVVLAGEGATSTLHRDPFEWTGTSLCLEGRKVWRFLSPVGTGNDSDNMNRSNDGWDDRLRSYRLESTAWSSSYGDDDQEENDREDDMVLSAGWQSDLSLFTSSSSSLRTARSLAELAETEATAYLDELASTTHLLTSHDEIQPAITMGVDCCSVVQHPGDLLLIPPYWYHQTYAPEPSLAVASQRCGSSIDAPRVLRHILALQPGDYVDPLQMPKQLSGLLDGSIDPLIVDPKKAVDFFFEYFQQSNKSRP